MSAAGPDIQITVKARYLPEQSVPRQNRYVFAYTITIANRDRQWVQLLRRRWTITDDRGRVQKVEGAGVVGETPVIEPGTEYTYTSGAILETPSGRMEGAYQMIDSDGAPFEAPIPEFMLLPPRMLH